MDNRVEHNRHTSAYLASRGNFFCELYTSSGFQASFVSCWEDLGSSGCGMCHRAWPMIHRRFGKSRGSGGIFWSRVYGAKHPSRIQPAGGEAACARRARHIFSPFKNVRLICSVLGLIGSLSWPVSSFSGWLSVDAVSDLLLDVRPLCGGEQLVVFSGMASPAVSVVTVLQVI